MIPKFIVLLNFANFNYIIFTTLAASIIKLFKFINVYYFNY